MTDLLDPSLCSCFSSHRNFVCTKLKWSTVSIFTALLIIIMYATSGLYTLIDVTTFMSMESHSQINGTILWPMFTSSVSTLLSWILLLIYFTIVLLTMILLCGIQFNKPWLLFLWSILMIIMLLIDGITTILTLRQYQKRTLQLSRQVQILFLIMITRLILSVLGIFITVFHFRYLNKAKSHYANRQRMLRRYNAESGSPSYDSSWTRSVGLINPSKDINDDPLISAFTQTRTLPRANLATVQRHPTSTLFHTLNSYNEQLDYADKSQQVYTHNEDSPYNISLKDRFQGNKIPNLQDL